jgi:ATP-dependent DNA helicase DinG
MHVHTSHVLAHAKRPTPNPTRLPASPAPASLLAVGVSETLHISRHPALDSRHYSPMSVPIDVEGFFGSRGPLAAALEGYEERAEQAGMAAAVRDTLRDGGRLLVEAGTGVGKSFAYLVPALACALERGKPVVVATHTISLQEQLIGKDLPFLERLFPEMFVAVLAKGRSNYLCRRRLDLALENTSTLFETRESEELRRLARWAQETADGSLADLPEAPDEDVWRQVCSEATACLGRKCPRTGSCFVWKARRVMAGAQLVVANHALLLADLSLRMAGSRLLPDFEDLVVDEAHDLERAADDWLGVEISSTAVQRFLSSLLAPKGGKGLLAGVGLKGLARAVGEARQAADAFFRGVEAWAAGGDAPRNLRVLETEFVPDPLSGPLRALGAALSTTAIPGADESLQAEVAARGRRAEELAGDLRSILELSRSGWATWVERGERGGRGSARLRAAPVRAGDVLGPELFGRMRAAVLTSATLAVGKENPFRHIADRLGLDDPATARFGSPFDFERQARLIVPRSMPDPRDEAYPEAVASAVKRYVARTEGRAFVLFTSYGLLARVRELAGGDLEALGYTLLFQVGTLSRAEMLARFRGEERAVLFGVASFWEGVDVRGEALSNVIITRLPFPVPDHPLVEARLERIREDGGNPFREFSVPEAVIRFKQGFGRLIRSKTDTGIVVVLDRRLLEMPYGRTFLESLPPIHVTEEE